MKHFLTAAATVAALSATSNALAMEYGGAAPIANAAVDGTASLDGVGYGASQYRTQYEISDILGAVSEDIAERLSDFLGRDLDRESGDPVADSAAADTGNPSEVSAS